MKNKALIQRAEGDGAEGEKLNKPDIVSLMNGDAGNVASCDENPYAKS